jgi:pSer/pThr/pTyr-binding forkhead associated (FHA) protein
VFKLTIEDDEGKTTVIPLIRDEMTIGRQEGNTIRLTERNISRKHARLIRQNGTVYVEDLTSYTGVRVNGARIVTATPVAEGDEVQIGDYKLMLRIDRPAVPVNPDRATMPAMPAALGPMNPANGSVAIPTRGTPGAMAAQVASAIQTAQYPLAPPPPPAVPPLTGVPARTSSPSQRAAAAAVPEAFDGQPTIPVRALDGAAAGAAGNARLVILTSELAGQEFSLAGSAVVIGRTEENDVVINHRSISRHHAKIVREGDRYTIVDLQSANGVRVNREDYERIDLKPGDIIELGHVKLRFVGAGESYAFDPKAPNARQERGPFPVKLAAGVGALMLAGVAVFALRGSRAQDEAAPVAAAPAAVASAPAAAAPVPQAAQQALLAEATKAAGEEDWAGAHAALEKLGPATAGAPLERESQELRRRVDLEAKASTLYAQFGEAVTAKTYADALARYGDIPAESIYKMRGRPRADEARSLLIAERLAEATQARTEGRCDDVRAVADELATLDPTNAKPKELVRLCRPKPVPVAAKAAAKPRVVAAAPRAAEAKPARQAEPKAEPKSERAEHAEAASAEDQPDADALVKQAREAWLNQQCGLAIDLARKAVKAKAGADAYQIIAVCSCSLKDAEGATRAYAKLDEKSRNLVHALCQKNGIIVGGE